MTLKLTKIHRGQTGITGLETAIILIAFVVVAAVFAYTALSAGLFSTQKAQEAVYGGLEETQSTIEQSGSVIAYKGDYVMAEDELKLIDATARDKKCKTPENWESSSAIR